MTTPCSTNSSSIDATYASKSSNSRKLGRKTGQVVVAMAADRAGKPHTGQINHGKQACRATFERGGLVLEEKLDTLREVSHL